MTIEYISTYIHMYMVEIQYIYITYMIGYLAGSICTLLMILWLQFQYTKSYVVKQYEIVNVNVSIVGVCNCRFCSITDIECVPKTVIIYIFIFRNMYLVH
jgi:hypothetical protein